MRPKICEVYDIWTDFLIHYPKVAGYIDAPISYPDVMERMIVEERMERIFKKHISSLSEMALLRYAKFLVSLFDFGMQDDSHE